ncbi:MAG: aldehyde dehydrogenase family protein [Chloroflexi bacterium]|nr:MAG: aldehyde dehydrogenase family protein [Chloroflexota bacterium]
MAGRRGLDGDRLPRARRSGAGDHAVQCAPQPAHAQDRGVGPAPARRSSSCSSGPGCRREAIQLLHGGAELGESLVRSPEVRAIAFTGSPAAGQRVAVAAGAKRLVLELGGNAATIVCADADLDEAARVCAETGYSNSGQSCVSVQRVYVERSRFEDFVARFRRCASQLRVGDPLDPATDVGTMVDPAAAARVREWVAEAVTAGARLELGGTVSGATLSPTLLACPPATARVVTEEVFGALVSVMPFDEFGDALREANTTSSNFRLDHVPFGGVKASGIGRESPRWMVEDFTALRTVIFRGASLWA